MILSAIAWLPTIIGLAILAFGLLLYVLAPDTPRVRYGKHRRHDCDCDCDDKL